MARKVIITVVDDVDGEATADETVEFGLDGARYEIDLTSRNAEELRNQLARWVARARKVTRGSVSGSHNRREGIRAWAQRNGHAVGSRGRIPLDVLLAFEAAH